MGKVVRERLLVLVVLTVVVGHVAVCVAYGGPNQYAVNYGVELSELEKQIPVNAGLAWGHYARSCPCTERIVSNRVAAYLRKDRGVAAGLVRLVFHDCFVQGCDASILLKLSSGTELDDPPNLTIRASALQLIDDIKARLERACPGIVSCADIVVLAARVAIQKVGGPPFHVPLGRRDSLSFSPSSLDLPSPFASFADQSSVFSSKGLSTTDLVALAGAHTLGMAHCGVYNTRLLPTVDPKMNPSYASYLKEVVCPTLNSSNATGLDFYSPNKFDNQYFQNLPSGGALMSSDQNLDQDCDAWGLVNKWAGNQKDFFYQFHWSFIKMSQIQILTGNSGEIRKVCSTTNSGGANEPIVELESVTDAAQKLQTVPDPSEVEPGLASMVFDGRAES